MDFFIPTLKRAGKQRTLANLPPEIRRRTTLVLDAQDYEENFQTYDRVLEENEAEAIICPDDVKGIALTREYIGKRLGNSKTFVMLDDDLWFYHRKTKDDWHLVKNTPDDSRRMFEYLEKLLETYAHASISMRMANNNPQKMDREFYENDRYVRVLAFQRTQFNSCIHGRVPVMEDFDVALQLISKGLPSAVVYKWCQDQQQTQAAGGCSTYRDHALHEAAVRRFHELWPKHTRLVNKKNKTGGAFGERLEIQIQWKAAFEEARRG